MNEGRRKKMRGKRMMTVFPTPLGWAGVAVTGKGITQVVLPRKGRQQAERDLHEGKRANRGPAEAGDARVLDRAVTQLRRYLSGRPMSFKLHLDLGTSTDFQLAVWRAAASIPYGETRSYAWIAQRIKKPKAARAVGQALGANPIPLLIP